MKFVSIVRFIVLSFVVVFVYIELDSIKNLVQWVQRTPISAGVIICGIVFLLVSYTWKLARKKK